MSNTSTHPVTWVLTGPVAGKTENFGGINFVEGRSVVGPQAHDQIGHLLRRCYSAKPEGECTPEELRKSPGSAGTGAGPSQLSHAQVRQMIEAATAEAVEKTREESAKQIRELQNKIPVTDAPPAQEAPVAVSTQEDEDDIAANRGRRSKR
jgi:hypothetical protein